MEKPLAAAAGVGWQGKHTNLVSRQHGSWLFLGAILTTLELPPDAPGDDHCGSCRACLDVCPTAAFPAPYRLDARRCISYLTIEHKGPIARELRPLMGNRIYGCDDCLAVCPWNKFAQAGREAKLAARAELQAPRLADLARLDDAAFRKLFAKSPVKRTGRDRFVRNVLIAIGNSGDASLADEAERLLADPSPLVRGAAVWALGRLDPQRLAALAPTHRPNETDPVVEEEWAAVHRIRCHSAERLGLRPEEREPDPVNTALACRDDCADSPQMLAGDYWVPAYAGMTAEGWRSQLQHASTEHPSKLRHGGDQPLDVLRPRQAVVAVLHQSEHDVVARKARGELDRVLPRHVRVLHALQDAHRTAGLDHAAEQEMLTALLDQAAGDEIGLPRNTARAAPMRPCPRARAAPPGGSASTSAPR